MATTNKSNWGRYLLLGMGCFMLFIVFLVVMMFKQPNDDYDPRYYERGLNYDNEFQLRMNVIKDAVRPSITVGNGICTITFKAAATGKITFVRPSDSKMDRSFLLKDQQEYTSPAGDIAAGRWQVTIAWKQNGKNYLDTQDIFIP